VRLLVGLGRLPVIPARLLHHPLERVHALAHAAVQRRLYEVEVVVQVLPEPNQELDRLVRVGLGVVLEQSELDYAVGELLVRERRELLDQLRRGLHVVVQNGGGRLHVPLGINEFKQKHLRQRFVFFVVEVEPVRNSHLRRIYRQIITLVRSVWNFT